MGKRKQIELRLLAALQKRQESSYDRKIMDKECECGWLGVKCRHCREFDGELVRFENYQRHPYVWLNEPNSASETSSTNSNAFAPLDEGWKRQVDQCLSDLFCVTYPSEARFSYPD